MHRRRFLRWALLSPFAAILGGSAILQGCGEEATDATPTGSGTACDGATPVTMDLHIHPLCIPQSLLDSPVDSTLTLQTALGHTHTIFLTAAQIATIAAGGPGPLVVASNPGLHTHNVTFLT